MYIIDYSCGDRQVIDSWYSTSFLEIAQVERCVVLQNQAESGFSLTHFRLRASFLLKTSVIIRIVGPQQVRCRVVVTTHPAGQTKSRVGLTRDRVVYELFFTTLPQSAFTAADVVTLYLHRGAFEPTLPMKTRNLTPTAGVVTPLPDRKRGRSSPSGSGTQIRTRSSARSDSATTTEFAHAVEEGQQPQGYGASVVGVLEGRALHGARLHPPARRDSALPVRQAALPWALGAKKLRGDKQEKAVLFVRERQATAQQQKSAPSQGEGA
jgi:hypothetical protein